LYQVQQKQSINQVQVQVLIINGDTIYEHDRQTDRQTADDSKERAYA